MGKAGKALKQVLETYGISQNRLSVIMGIQRSNINRWVNETTDPAGDSVIEIGKGLRQINQDAAKEFITLYIADLVDDQEQGSSE